MYIITPCSMLCKGLSDWLCLSVSQLVSSPAAPTTVEKRLVTFYLKVVISWSCRLSMQGILDTNQIKYTGTSSNNRQISLGA